MLLFHYFLRIFFPGTLTELIRGPFSRDSEASSAVAHILNLCFQSLQEWKLYLLHSAAIPLRVLTSLSERWEGHLLPLLLPKQSFHFSLAHPNFLQQVVGKLIRNNLLFSFTWFFFLVVHALGKKQYCTLKIFIIFFVCEALKFVLWACICSLFLLGSFTKSEW